MHGGYRARDSEKRKRREALDEPLFVGICTYWGGITSQPCVYPNKIS